MEIKRHFLKVVFSIRNSQQLENYSVKGFNNHKKKHKMSHSYLLIRNIETKYLWLLFKISKTAKSTDIIAYLYEYFHRVLVSKSSYYGRQNQYQREQLLDFLPPTRFLKHTAYRYFKR